MLTEAFAAVQAVDPSVLRAFGSLLISATAVGTAFGLAAGWALKRR